MAKADAAAGIGSRCSALLAYLNEEEGAAVVREAMEAGAAISVANWAEVLTKLAERGEDPEVAVAEMKGAGLIGGVVTIEAITEEDCIAIARLRRTTKAQGLSLADRAFLPWPSAWMSRPLPRIENGSRLRSVLRSGRSAERCATGAPVVRQ